MNDELPTKSSNRQPLDARFASRPHMAARLHEIADMMDAAIERGATADEAEEMALQQLRSLGNDLLTDWAMKRHDQAIAQAREQNPQAVKHTKKK